MRNINLTLAKSNDTGHGCPNQACAALTSHLLVGPEDTVTDHVCVSQQQQAECLLNSKKD